MPRLINSTRELTKKRYDRASKKRIIGKAWIDPFPTVQGTRPEKIVYAELNARSIPFYFQTEIDLNFSDVDVFKVFRPDFVIPDMKIIIEVQGSYWHSQAKTIESDATKFTFYELAGYKVLIWWDYDIETNLHLLFALAGLSSRVSGVNRKNQEVITSRRVYRDDSKGIRTINRKRGIRMEYKRKAVRILRRKGK